MADAQQLESAGHVSAALDMARRADSVLSTASRTLGVQWPAGQRSPADYVGQLEQRLRASVPVQQQNSGPLRKPGPLPTGSRPSNTPQDGSPASVASPASGPLLDWRNRGRATAAANDGQGPPEHSRPVERPIQLIGAGGQSHDSASDTEEKSGDAGISNLLDHLRSLDTWEVSGGSGVNAPDAARGESSPAQSPQSRTRMPATGGWQPGINDQNVGPIPTQVPHTPFDNSSSEPSAPVLQHPPERLTVEKTAVPTPAEQTGVVDAQ
ncbi:MAG: hypothetical protein ABGZ17_17110, partial [Planctomycetaceae bacterium]